ncbi:MAG: hypothetical protein LJE83_13195 [Gammaproteobacteria bacterium]|jgi:hypothetical protein|nr:hypothetical protein [Gammaproteobacteria bacterium]
MQYDEFIQTLKQARCPAGLGPYLEALWYDANDNWHKAHIIVQQLDDSTAARIHAYLHRKEGDIWNSKYWHRQAGSSLPQGMSLQAEWEMLVRQLTQAR